MSRPSSGPLAGTLTLIRHVVRRDRFRLIIWVAAAVFVSTATYGAYEGLYPTVESRQGLQAQMGASTSLKLLYGPAFDLTNAGGFIAWRVGLYTALVLSIFAILTVVRQTRAEEDAGRAEMLAVGVVGRYAMLAAALTVSIGTAVIAGLLMAGILAAAGADVVGALAFGAAAAACAGVFAAVAAVAVQLGSYSRSANGIAFGVLGMSFLLRGWGDATDRLWVSWLSPMGWVSQIRAFAGNRWEVFGLFAGLFLVLIATAALLVRQRDVGLGLLKPREGRADAPASLRGVFGLAWRLQRGLLLGWAIAFLIFGSILGSLATALDDLIGDNEQVRQAIERMGGTGQTAVLFVAAILPILGVIAVLYGVGAMLRTRTEETEGRLEPLLATPVSRWRWLGSHLLMALGGSALLVILGGGAVAAVASASVPEGTLSFVDAFKGVLIQIPATWLIVAISAALVGVAPRLAGLGWAAAGVALALTWLGPALGLPDAALKISPFEHLPKVPGHAVTAPPLLIISAGVVALIAIAGIGLRRRDIAS
jgi:ABC-2 type transport system permease protein